MSIKLTFYSAWDSTDGKDETTAFDENTYYDDTEDASVFFDDWIGEHFDSYVSTGTRISDAIDLSLGNYICLGSTINFVASTPSGTSVAVYTSLDNGDNWTEVNNGDAIPGLTLYSDLDGVSLLFKQVFTTSDELVSSTLTSVTIEIDKGVAINNNSDLSIYPEIEFTMAQSGTIQIINKSNSNQTLQFDNLQNGETVYIDCDNKTIISSLEPTIYRASDHNNVFLELIRGNNYLQIVGDCTIYFRYQGKLLTI